ncbi:MAG: cobalamin biosynthesis protein [Clostridiales bacterium]|nr:cobalamin biosynthesis protein [Clostridiales bacterium]
MYLLCYGRSDKSQKLADDLIGRIGGRRIESAEFFTSRAPLAESEKGACIVMILPLEAACGIISDNYSPAISDLPVICVSPDGRFAAVLRRAGALSPADTDEAYKAITGALGRDCFTSFGDNSDFAPDLTKTARIYNMTANDPELLLTVNSYIRAGGRVSIFTDLPVAFAEPVIDSLIFDINRYGTHTREEFTRAYISEKKEDSDRPAVFVTCSHLPDAEGSGRPLVLTPRRISIGLEIKDKTDPDYAVKYVRNTLINHMIEPGAVSTVAVTQSAHSSQIVRAIADDLGASVTAYPAKRLSEVVVPLQMTFAPEKMHDVCTAAACLASSDGNILIRRAGGNSGLVLTAALQKGNIMMTE